MDQESSPIQYNSTGDILQDMRSIIETARDNAYRAVNISLVRRNWLLGRRIAEEELGGGDRAEYGLEIIKKLSKELTDEYGKGFTKTNLYNFYLFYKTFPEIFQTASGKSIPMLTWSHYETLLRVKDRTARAWYAKEAAEQTWAVRTLRRNIDTQYYYRLLSSQNAEPVETEMRERTTDYQQDKGSASFIKGFLLQFVNIKIYMFGITALTGFITPYSKTLWVLVGFELLIATIGTIATSTWIGAGLLIQKFYIKHYRIINIILALTLVECIWSMLKT